jgi:hypothetical protein
MVYTAWRAGASVIDMTPSVTAVHQRHDYRHYRGGVDRLYSGDEGRRNRILAGTAAVSFGLRDATHVLTVHGIEPAWRVRGVWQWTLGKLRQRLHLLRAASPVMNRGIDVGLSVYRRLRRTDAPIGWPNPAASASGPERNSRRKPPDVIGDSRRGG